MELQVAGRRPQGQQAEVLLRDALAGIKADIANKRLLVRKPPPPPLGGAPHPTPPPREGIAPLALALALTPMGSTIRRSDSER
jgi:hypothetical protein